MSRILPLALLVCAVVAVVIVLTRGGEPLGAPGARPDTADDVSVAAAAPGTLEDAPARAELAATPAPATADDPAAELGALVVRVVWGENGEPAAAVFVDVHFAGGDERFDTRTARTGGDGVARFTRLPARRVLATVERGGLDAFARADVVAGRETEVEVKLAGGVAVTGRVVDADGVAVPGADVVVAPWAGGEARPLARTDSDGRFALRAIGSNCHVGARAVGYAPSVLQLVSGGDGAAVEVRIVLPARGGAVTGTVLGPEGLAVEDARVQIGNADQGHVETFADGTRGKLAMPAHTRTDADGGFAVDGLAAGETPVVVRARGLAPWQGTVEVRVAERAEIVVRLEAGAVLTGTVRDDAGEPMKGVRIDVGTYRDLDHRSTSSDDEGRYRIDGLAAGDLALTARSETHGSRSASVTAAAGRTVEWNVVLSEGLSLRGRVVDDAGAPIERAMLEASQRPPEGGPPWFRGATTDADGRFQLAGCAPSPGITLSVRIGSMFPQLTVQDLLPGPAEVLVRVPRVEPCWITGRVVGPDGQPAANVTVSPVLRGHGSSPVLTTEADTGAFRLGPYPPGDYRVGIEAAGFPSLRTPWRTLDAGENADLGTIRLQAGGALAATLVAADGGAAPIPSLAVLDAQGEHVARAEVADGVARTDLLPPGAYLLQVRGATVASAELPFTIRPGVDTPLRVRVEVGVPIALSLTAPASMRRARVEVFDASGRAVLRASVWRGRDGAMATEFGLRQGSYRIVATTEEGARIERAIEVAQGGAVALALTLR